ncbi:MAG: MFS transporter, partial [Candidatus Izemoplasmatales bacterium]
MEQSKLSSRIWISIVMFGLFGQIAWVIENMYFNLFLYNTISGDTNAIALMVTASAIVATITTMLMGALSDKVGKRKIFICLGYVLWGLSTLSFGFISTANIEAVFPTANAVMIAVAAVIVMDCIMTFFGSSANDSAFNAWVTDITDDTNRPKVEGLLAILPLLALLLIFGAFDGLTKSDNWPAFFFILGGLVTLGGIIGFFLIGDSKVQKPKGQYWHEMIYGFKLSTIKQHPILYTTFITFALFGIATQIYMPYFIIYIQQYLGIDNYALLLGVVILSASIVSLFLSLLVKATTLRKLFYPSLGIFIIGLLMLFFAREPIWVGVAGF